LPDNLETHLLASLPSSFYPLLLFYLPSLSPLISQT